MRRKHMLGNSDVMTDLAVKDLKTAKRFYEEVLGLKLAHGEGDEGLVFKSGNSTLHVYKSQYAGTNKATAATWQVDDIERITRDLKTKGVSFEHYDMPGMVLKGDVHVAEGMKVAWFKDPDGNILCLANG